MNDNTPSIRGYRTLGEPAKNSIPSTNYLQQTPKAAKLLKILWDKAPDSNTPCLGKPGEWTSDELPTDREAQKMCAPCPLRNICKEYADEAHVAHGVWGGEVHGRKLAELMKEDNE